MCAERSFRSYLTIIPCVLVLLAGAALRFWGLGWGLPNSLHSYSYHPDEFLVMGAAGSVLLTGFPRFYNYPSLFIYLVAIAVSAGSAYGLVHGLAGMYLCARVVSALMGVVAVAAAYWAGKSIWGRAEGLLAALVLCIAPLHVQHSHFATVDVPSTLFVAACFGYAGLVLKRGSWRDYVLCGVMAGLAAGTKYNAGLVVLSLIAAHFIGGKERNAGLRRLLAALGCAIAAFVICTPASILRSSEFVYGLTYELHHSATGHGLVFAGTGNGFVYTFTSSLWYGLGPALAILFGAATIYGVSKMDRRALTILAFAIPYYALISISQVRFARYALPLLPAAALLIGWMACDLWSRFPRAARWAWAGLFAVIIAGTLLYTIALDRLFVQPPPQDRAARWIFANVPKGSSIGVIDVPWFYSPPYSKKTGLGALQQREQAMATASYRLRMTATPAMWETSPWWVISDYEVSDAIRLWGSRDISPDDRLRLGVTLRKLEYARGHLYSGRAFSSSLGMFGSAQSLPHDMRYPAPTIWIYEKKK